MALTELAATYAIAMVKIDEIAQEFSVSFTVNCCWKLSGDLNWKPKFRFPNYDGPDEEPEVCPGSQSPDGTYFYQTLFWPLLKIGDRFELQKFPFDRQKFVLHLELENGKFVNWSQAMNDACPDNIFKMRMRFELDILLKSEAHLWCFSEESQAFACILPCCGRFETSQAWKKHRKNHKLVKADEQRFWKSGLTHQNYYSQGISHVEIPIQANLGPQRRHIHVYLQRVSAFYYHQFLPVMACLGLISFVTVLFETDSVDRFAFTVTLILAAGAFKTTVADMIPKTGQNTLLDSYVLLLFMILSVTLLKDVIVFQSGLRVFDWLWLALAGVFWITLHTAIILFIKFRMFENKFRLSWPDVEDNQSDLRQRHLVEYVLEVNDNDDDDDDDDGDDDDLIKPSDLL